jgi:hypothetical protein
MRGDVLSCAAAESGGDSAAPVYAAVPIVSHAGGLAVKLDGTSTNRTADEASVAQGRTTRSSPDGHKEIFRKPRLGAGPRTGLRRQPAWPPAACASALDSGHSACGGNRGPSPSSAKSGPHANAATGLRPPDTPRHNTVTGHTADRRTARSLSTDSGAAAAPDRSLALKMLVEDDEVDPRERQLPKGQVPERPSTSPGRICIRRLLLRLPSPLG